MKLWRSEVAGEVWTSVVSIHKAFLKSVNKIKLQDIFATKLCIMKDSFPQADFLC